MHIKKRSEKDASFSSIYTRKKKRGSPNGEPRKNEVACNGVEIKLEPVTVETFDLLSPDDDIDKKPCVNKNTNFGAGTTINTGDDDEYEFNNELEEGNDGDDDDELGSDEEEEDKEEEEK